MNERLKDVEYHLSPVSTEAPWRTGLNERPHRYLQKTIDHLLLQQDYETVHEHEVFLADAEII